MRRGLGPGVFVIFGVKYSNYTLNLGSKIFELHFEQLRLPGLRPRRCFYFWISSFASQSSASAIFSRFAPRGLKLPASHA